MALSDSDLETRLRALGTWADDMAPARRDLAVTVRSRHRRQRRSRLTTATVGFAVALVLLGVQLVSPGVLGGGQRDDSVAAPSASAGPSTSARPAPPSSTGSTPTVRGQIHGRDWTTYTSEQYFLEVGHPVDWIEMPATRRWTVDDAGDRLSPAHDTFQPPSGDVGVGIWQVPLDSGTSVDSAADLAAWVEGYCEESDDAPCAGIEDRAVELCLEKWDCHPGLLVPFSNDVEAFFSGGFYSPGAMTVVTVWGDDAAPALAPYGGARGLLEAVLSTMAVWPASTPRDERTCYGRPPSGLSCRGSG